MSVGRDLSLSNPIDLDIGWITSRSNTN